MPTSPTVRRRRLGTELRGLRERVNMTHAQVAAELDCSQGKISHIELGKVPVRVPDLNLMCQLYNVSAPHQDILTKLAKEGRQRGWWEVYAEALQNGFATYVGLETEARSLRMFNIDLVPGVLQTETYMRRVIQASRPDLSDAEVQQRVEVRLARQERLGAEDHPLEIWVVLDEAAIRRVVGGKKVMRAQLQHLLKQGDLPNVTIQVLPFDIGEHPIIGDKLTLIEFADPADPFVVYLENSASCVCLEEPEEVRSYRLNFERLTAAALSPLDSARLIDEAMEALT
jgi:transcriptional regulator with XRE-family HTH domain